MATIRIETLEGDGSFDAYVAEPAGTPAAAIIVIQEIFGVNEGIRRKCDHWAELGYLALAPDLFWRLEPGVELDPDVPEEFQAGARPDGQVRPGPGDQRHRGTIRAARAAWPKAARSAASAIASAAGSPS